MGGVDLTPADEGLANGDAEAQAVTWSNGERDGSGIARRGEGVE